MTARTSGGAKGKKQPGAAAKRSQKPAPSAKVKRAKTPPAPRAKAKPAKTQPRAKAPAKSIVKKKPTAVTAIAAARAAKLAQRMPLVHYPAATPFTAWSKWPDGLLCRTARGETIAAGDFEQLRGNHVFFYAGPCCYQRRDSVGDAVVYFDPSADDGHDGGTTPFDSGALEDPTPKLRPWAQALITERWKFFEAHAHPLAGWRKRFERWLAASYDAPDRYIETPRNRWEAGQPDRLNPPEILEHNGTRGYARHGADCADRRAWTWEVRVADRLAFGRVRALHVAVRQLRKAYDVAARMRWKSGFVPEVKTLRRGVEPSPDTLYADSGRVLRELTDR